MPYEINNVSKEQLLDGSLTRKMNLRMPFVTALMIMRDLALLWILVYLILQMQPKKVLI